MPVDPETWNHTENRRAIVARTVFTKNKGAGNIQFQQMGG